MAKFLKKHLTSIILYAILIFGLCLLLYPTVADWWNSMHQSRAIASYVEAVADMNSEEMDALLEQARRYNERLASSGIEFQLTEEQLAEYESLLDISGTGIMGYVQIPKINVSLPVYHGADEAVLQIAVGHIAGTSFPIGGENTHSVLSGHRGLPSARLFTDLDQILVGDVFTVTVLNETITYQVDQIRIVEPSDVSELMIIPGEDHCTLVTCTPYGINTHRMLVRGIRIEDIDEKVMVNADAVQVHPYVVIPSVVIPIVFLILLGMLIYYRFKKPTKTNEALLENIKEVADEKRGGNAHEK